jgi:hypothetical protein
MAEQAQTEPTQTQEHGADEQQRGEANTAVNAAGKGEQPNEPTWLPRRLDEAKRSAQRQVFEQYGVKSQAELDAKFQRLKELEDAQLTDQERTKKQLDELAAKAQAGERYRESFAKLVDAEFGKLTDEQRQAIDRQAAGDPDRRWQLMELAAAFQQPATGTTRPAANSTNPAAPRPPSPVPAKTPFETFLEMKAMSPNLAAIFYTNNKTAIEKSRPSQ